MGRLSDRMILRFGRGTAEERSGETYEVSDRGGHPPCGDLPAGGWGDDDYGAGQHELDESQYEDGKQHQRRPGEGAGEDVRRRGFVPEPLYGAPTNLRATGISASGASLRETRMVSPKPPMDINLMSAGRSYCSELVYTLNEDETVGTWTTHPLLSNGADYERVMAALFSDNFPKDVFAELEEALKADGLLGEGEALTYGNAGRILPNVELSYLLYYCQVSNLWLQHRDRKDIR